MPSNNKVSPGPFDGFAIVAGTILLSLYILFLPMWIITVIAYRFIIKQLRLPKLPLILVIIVTGIFLAIPVFGYDIRRISYSIQHELRRISFLVGGSISNEKIEQTGRYVYSSTVTLHNKTPTVFTNVKLQVKPDFMFSRDDSYQTITLNPGINTFQFEFPLEEQYKTTPSPNAPNTAIIIDLQWQDIYKSIYIQNTTIDWESTLTTLSSTTDSSAFGSFPQKFLPTNIPTGIAVPSFHGFSIYEVGTNISIGETGLDLKQEEINLKITLKDIIKNTFFAATIRKNGCTNEGQSIYTLNNVINGRSDTTLMVPLSTFAAYEPMSLHLYDETGTLRGCHDIKVTN